MAILSCSNKQIRNDGIYPVINLNPGSNELSHKNVMEIIGRTEIKADDALFIGEAAKIDVFNSEYYIMDDKIQKCILRYSKEGVLINRIGKSGDGPGEYPHIIDFTIDKGKSKIFILSAMSDVYIYSLDGTFEDKVNLSDDVICKVSCNPSRLNGNLHILIPHDEYKRISAL